MAKMNNICSEVSKYDYLSNYNSAQVYFGINDDSVMYTLLYCTSDTNNTYLIVVFIYNIIQCIVNGKNVACNVLIVQLLARHFSRGKSKFCRLHVHSSHPNRCCR